MTSEVTVVEGELPLSHAQIEKLVQLVMKKLEEKKREAQKAREATELRRQASSPFEAGV
jgi:hypothetical protein